MCISGLFLGFFRKENVVIHFSSKMGRDELVSGLHAYMYIPHVLLENDAYCAHVEFSNFGSVKEVFVSFLTH